MTTASGRVSKDALLPSSGFAFGGGTKPLSELVFKKYDLDNNGWLSRNELRSMCYDMGYYLSDDEIAWAWTVLDKNGSGTIDYNEFAEWWKKSSRFDHLKMPNEQQAHLLCRVVEIFRSYDKTNIGSLDRAQFTTMVHELIDEGIINGSEHLACEFEQIDRSHDERININELIAWLINVGVLRNNA
ncbi:unnamed protein product [Rotaria sp. Silwood1]|nr:unnamed protein product [Rotaria sp. Silwood1]CAF3510778.1 unnamed protein product [Rotaria sp. Silwood1]CAF3516580.1 unnamed protein product [Rotaria sp. Silwood1]CAF4638919.1 unnamed protein product [Rotaria sp. Silwood1]CAF4685502.1 unnamed protein product [Rotaria sp. Silwood1]